MRQHMPGTSTEPEVARRYAAGEASFDDIAEDRGPREATTLDLLFDAQGFRARLRAQNGRIPRRPGSDAAFGDGQRDEG